MRLMTRLSVAFSAATVLAMSFAGVGSASANAAAPVRALDACPATYTADFTAITTDFQAAATALTADKLGPIALKLIQLRYKYEDGAVPAGCEAQQQAVVKALALFDDGALLSLGLALDTKNVATYNDEITKIWLPRTKTLGSAALPSAAPAMAATAAAAQICPDKAFTQKIASDFASLGNLSATETSPAVIGALGLKVINLRYAYEDMTVPVGCEGAQKVVATFFLLATDQVALTLAKLGDTANAATYDAFIKKDLNDRGTKSLSTLGNYLDLNVLMSATAAPTAAQ